MSVRKTILNTYPVNALKTLKYRSLLKYRSRNWEKRSLPDFLIIGAMKSGTTSLYAYLKQHPMIIPSIKKEIHYFDNGWKFGANTLQKGEKWYRSHFPVQNAKNKICFEASPSYLYNPDVPKRIFELIPKVKIIVAAR